MSHLDHSPDSDSLLVVRDVVVFGVSREVASSKLIADLSSEAQAALAAILSAIDAKLPAAESPMTVRRTITTILQSGQSERLARAYYLTELAEFGVSQEGQVAIEAADASPELLAAWQTLSAEVFT